MYAYVQETSYIEVTFGIRLQPILHGIKNELRTTMWKLDPKVMLDVMVGVEVCVVEIALESHIAQVPILLNVKI